MKEQTAIEEFVQDQLTLIKRIDLKQPMDEKDSETIKAMYSKLAKHEEDNKADIKKAFIAGCFKGITDLTVVKQDAEKLSEQYYEANNENKRN
jgi:hypothetical protein